jgi:hypothetical protein
MRKGNASQLTLVETPTFAKRRPSLLAEDEYRLLQITLALNPAAGAVIPGSGGVRKIRWEVEGHGKRGGARVVYYWAKSAEVVLLLLAYSKSEQDNLTKHQLHVLAKLVKEEFK